MTVVDGGSWKNYKLLVDRKTFKASKCESSKQARFVERAAQIFLKHKMPFPKILKRYKQWLLQEWIEGAFLRESQSTNSLIRELATILAKMHSIHLTEIRIKAKKPTIKTKIKFVLKKLGYLKQKKVANSKQTKQLKKYLIENAPKELDLVLTQRDISSGNIMTKNGKLYKIIDYEDTCIEIKEFDIARTIYSLRLNKKQEKE